MVYLYCKGHLCRCTYKDETDILSQCRVMPVNENSSPACTSLLAGGLFIICRNVLVIIDDKELCDLYKMYLDILTELCYSEHGIMPDTERSVIMTIFQIPSVKQTIQKIIPQSVKKKTLLTEIDNMFYKAYKAENLSARDRSDPSFAASVWLYASLADAALNDTPYAASNYGCEKEWDNAVRWLKFEMGKRKWFSSVLLHDVYGICERAAQSLKVLNAASCGGTITDWVRSNGESLTVFYDNIHSLETRLYKAAEVAKAWRD